MDRVKIVETPRDAMQGIKPFIPTEKKVEYIQILLNVGFDIVDFGSFVSPKAIPQLKDSAEVLERLDLSATNTKLLAIVGNLRGARQGVQHDKVSYLGYPHSVSDRFLMLNLSSSLDKSRKVTSDILNVCESGNTKLLVYLSMAFGNPYGEEWNVDLLMEECEALHSIGVRHIALSDTVGASYPASIAAVFMALVPEFPDIEFSFHLHTSLEQWYEKIDAAYYHGCRTFDGVINGLGGCPMAGHKLVGNIQTGRILEYIQKNDLETNINKQAFDKALAKSITTFADIDTENGENFLE